MADALRSLPLLLTLGLIQAVAALGAEIDPGLLPGSRVLTGDADLMTLSIQQWDALLRREIAASRETREKFWRRDLSTPAAFDSSVQANRARLRQWIGVMNPRLPQPVLEVTGPVAARGLVAETSAYTVLAVRWPVLAGVHGEGLLVQPKGRVQAHVVLLPDADQAPEELAGLGGPPREKPLAGRLAESGVRVLIPVLVDRGTQLSGDERLGIFTNQTHREWLYRPAAEVGRHLIGYEVEKVFSALEALGGGPPSAPPVGVIGYGEGGLIALHAAALEPRIAAAWVSGYFQPREQAWAEPLYRNVWRLLTEFGDAELAALVATRTLVVEHSAGPTVPSPRPSEKAPGYARSAAPGELKPARFAAVSEEWARALALVGPDYGRKFSLVHGAAGATVPFGSDPALRAFLAGLGVAAVAPGGNFTPAAAAPPDAAARQRRTVREIADHVQGLARRSEYERERTFWSKLPPASASEWAEAVRTHRRRFAEEIIGEWPRLEAPLDPRTRPLPQYDNPRWRAFEVVLDVQPEVITWGYLLLPKDLAPGERRPVVVCQHGAGVLPAALLAGPDQRDHAAYQAYAARLADEGFVVYCPYNPNTAAGEDFRQLHRKGHLVGRTVFAIITANHRRVLEWLGRLPFVDARRIGLYGLSYGGKTALRVPALLEGYCLSVCSGDFNDYVAKMTATSYDKNPFTFTIAYETTEFNLAPTFNYAEMAALIAPRPFMVEHGYKDRVAPLEWAAAEYARVARLYLRLGVPERTAIEYFDGPHMIHGRGTFAFLREHLQWRH